MKIKVNGCVDCGKPCMLFCPLRDDSYIWECDKCGDETQLYEYEEKELCIDCNKQSLTKVN